jgi:Tol biopolymer transport system component
METLDFELEIGPQTGETYPVAARAPGGEAAASMRLPLARQELEHQVGVIQDAVLASSAAVRRRATDDEQPVQQFGRRLFDALISEDVRGLYVASIQQARERGAVLRLVLRLRPPELARLPWEFLFDAGQHDYLGLSMPVVRYPHALAPRRPLQIAPPLRILGMVARPGDQEPLEIDDEQRRLRAAVAGLERDGLVELCWVSGQSYTDLEDAMDGGPWHAFHFVGHGGYDPASEEGTIALSGERGRSDPVGADDLSRLLADHHTLRLVVLNACDTGRGSVLDVFSSTAGALVRRGISAVVAMQFPISDPAAVAFAQTFYQNVAKQVPLDASVMRARRALRRIKKDSLEWGTPVLYLRAPDGRLFGPAPTTLDPEPAVTHPRAQGQADAEELERIYDQALAAFWTERWDEAVALLRQVLAHQPHRAEATAKLEQARRQQQLATRYAEASAAAEALEWDRAVAGFTMVTDADPTYRQAREWLEYARRGQQLASLSTEARRLYDAGQWEAVIKIGERLGALDPALADAEGLVTSARARLAAVERAELLASRYRAALHLLEAGNWQQAVETLTEITRLDPEYRDTAPLLARGRRELSYVTTPLPNSPRVTTPQSRTPLTLQHRSVMYAVAFSPDGHRLATAGAERTARIWDTLSGAKTLSVAHPFGSGRLRTLAFSPDGRQLATGSDDKTARVWDATSGQQLTTVTHRGRVWGLAFSPDGRKLATGSDDKTACIWDTASGLQLATVSHDDAVRGVAFSPDGRWLASASDDRTVRIWNPANGEQLASVAHRGRVWAVTFSPNGRWLASGSDDNTVRIWEATGARQIILNHDSRVWMVAFSRNGRWLASASDDKTARIWDIDTGQTHYALTHRRSVYGLAFSPDGRRLATACYDCAVRIWDLDESMPHA